MIKTLLVLLMSPFFLTALYDSIFYLPSSTLSLYPDLNGLYTIFFIIQILLYLIFSIFFISIYNRRANELKHGQVNSRIISDGFGVFVYVLISVVCVLLFLFLFYSVFNDFGFSKLLTDNAKFYAQSKVGTAWVFFLYQFLIFLMMYDIYRSRAKFYKIVFLFMCILLIALTGGRSTIISYFIFIGFIYFIAHGNRVSIPIIVGFIGVFVVVFAGNSLLRHGKDTSFLDYINSDAFKLDFNSSFVLQDSIDYVHSNDDHYLVSLEDAYYAFVPRKLMPTKPVSTAETRLVYEDMLSDGRTTNITFGIYGNMVINFGYAGLFIGFVLLFLANFQYIKICLRLSQRNARDFIYMFLFMMFVLVLRGGFFNMRIFLSLIVVTAVVFSYELFKSLRLIR